MLIGGKMLLAPDGEFVNLGPVQAGLIRELANAHGPMTMDALMSGVYMGDEPENDSSLRVTISQMNGKKLRQVGLRIVNLMGGCGLHYGGLYTLMNISEYET